MEKVSKEDLSLGICYLNNYERGILLAISQNVGSSSVVKSFGHSASKYKRYKELMKNYIFYRVIWKRHSKEIKKILYRILTRKRFISFVKILDFPIRRSAYYVERRLLNYSLQQSSAQNKWSQGVIVLVKVCLERIFKAVLKDIDKFPLYFLEWLYYFTLIVFKGRIRRRYEEWLAEIKVYMEKR